MWFDEYRGDKTNPCICRYIPICQCNLNGDVICYYKTIQDASRETGISGYKIRKYLEKGSQYNNTIFKYII